MKKRMLADVLWEAANEYLPAYSDSASCWAVEDACGNNSYVTEPAISFLESLGLDPHRYAFQRFASGERRQGVRYMWLLLAMHAAEDEGIEV